MTVWLEKKKTKNGSLCEENSGAWGNAQLTAAAEIFFSFFLSCCGALAILFEGCLADCARGSLLKGRITEETECCCCCCRRRPGTRFHRLSCQIWQIGIYIDVKELVEWPLDSSSKGWLHKCFPHISHKAFTDQMGLFLTWIICRKKCFLSFCFVFVFFWISCCKNEIPFTFLMEVNFSKLSHCIQHINQQHRHQEQRLTGSFSVCLSTTRDLTVKTQIIQQC